MCSKSTEVAITLSAVLAVLIAVFVSEAKDNISIACGQGCAARDS